MDEGHIIIFIILYSSPISVQKEGPKPVLTGFVPSHISRQAVFTFLLNKVLIPSTAMITANTTIVTISTH